MKSRGLQMVMEGKKKFDECKKCRYNDYCLGFYKNWVEFVWEKYTKEMIEKFLNKENY